MADATVELPGGKRVPKRALIIAAGGAGIFVLWRYMRAGASSAATADPGGTYSDTASLVGGSGQSEDGHAGTGSPTGYGQPSDALPVLDNAGWVRSATDYLTGIGYDSTTVAAALGRYLAGQATEADRSIITTALGSLGTPPQGSYGWPVITPAPTPTQSGGGTTPAPSGGGGTTPAPSGSGGTTTKLLAPGYGWFATGGTTYTVDSIARRYDLTKDQLLALNPSLKGKSTVPLNSPVKVRSNAAAWDLAAYRKVNHL